MDDYIVECQRNGEVIASYTFSVPHSIAAPGMADATQVMEDAKAQLTTDRLAFPPYDDIKFSMRHA